MLRRSATLEDCLHSPAPSVSRLALPGFAGSLLLGPCPGRRKEALDDTASRAALTAASTSAAAHSATWQRICRVAGLRVGKLRPLAGAV